MFDAKSESATLRVTQNNDFILSFILISLSVIKWMLFTSIQFLVIDQDH